MSKKWLIVVGGLAVAVVGFLLFRPDKLFVDDVADEPLESAFGAEAAATDTTLGEDASPSPAIDEDTSSTLSESASPPTTPAPTTSSLPGAPTTSAPATTPPEPTLVSSGPFFGIDHEAAGTASIYAQNGRYVLRFEDDTDIQNGPDLYVWLTSGTDWYDPGDHIDLGTLKGNIGGQNYELPADFDPEGYGSVLIWCLRFAVPFAAVELG